jgi:hypothetical protein
MCGRVAAPLGSDYLDWNYGVEVGMSQWVDVTETTAMCGKMFLNNQLADGTYEEVASVDGCQHGYRLRKVQIHGDRTHTNGWAFIVERETP